MKALSVMALLLTLCLGTVPAAAARARPAREGEAEKLTPEEEREARALAVRFVKQFRETLEAAPLIKSEMFVGDLPERIRKQPSNESFPKPFDDGVAGLASDEDLRRFFAAFTNVLFQYWALAEADKFGKRHTERHENCGEETPFERLVPREAFSVLASDPTFGPTLAGWLREDGGASDEGVEDAGGPLKIDSPQQLGSFVSLVEEALAVTRRHLNNLPAWQRARQHVPYFNPGLNPDERETVSVEATEVEEDFFGLSEGEEMVCARVLMFHLDLVKVNGRLKILAVSFDDYKVRTREEAEKADRLSELSAAIEDDAAEAVESLLAAGVGVNERDDDCTTPVLRAAMSKRLEMVRLLIERGADVNLTNRHVNSPLLYAAADGDVKMTRALLDAGADVNAPDGAGCSPLCFALRFSASESHLKVIELLKSRGAVK